MTNRAEFGQARRELGTWTGADRLTCLWDPQGRLLSFCPMSGSREMDSLWEPLLPAGETSLDLLAERLQSLWSSRMSGRWTEPQGQSRSHTDNHGEACSCRGFWVTTSRESPTETSGSPGLGPCRDQGLNSRAPPFACVTTGG